MVNWFAVLIFQFLILASCQVYNSASNDQVQYSSDGTPFGDAKVIFSMKCTPCHDYYSKTELELTALGLLAPGDIYSSALYSRLKGSSVGGLENMPSNGQLTDAELDKVKIWIESMPLALQHDFN